MDDDRLLAYHQFTREHGVNRFVYFISRCFLEPFFLIYFRLSRIGREHAKVRGPLIVASNHRSFLDPFLIGAMLPWSRPVLYVAKMELFQNRHRRLDPQPARRLPGAPRPVRPGRPHHLPRCAGKRPRDLHLPRGHEDPYGLARASQAGLRPARARDRRGGAAGRRTGFGVRAPGRPHPPAQGEAPRRASAHLPADRQIPHRSSPTPSERASGRWSSCSGSGSAACRPYARPRSSAAEAGGRRSLSCLARGGLDVQLGCRTAEQAEEMNRTRANERYLPGITLPEGLTVKRASEIELSGMDLVCLGVPSKGLPAAVGSIGDRVGDRTSVLMLSKGLVAPMGALPSEYVGERVRARAIACLGGPAHANEAVSGTAALVLGSADTDLRAMLGEVFDEAGLVCERTDGRHRRRDGRGREERGRAGRRGRGAPRDERRRHRRVGGLARMPRLRGAARRPPRDVLRPGGDRRPDGHDPRPEQPQPARGRAARQGDVRRRASPARSDRPPRGSTRCR